MTIDDFVEITRRVIATDGWGNYLPTLYLPMRCHIAVLEGIPSDVEIGHVALNWAREKSGGEEFLVAFKIDPLHFKVIRCCGANQEEAVFLAQVV